MRKEDAQQIREALFPIVIQSVLAQADQKAFESEDRGGVVVSELMDKPAIRHAFAVIQDAVIGVFALEMRADERLKLLQRRIQRVRGFLNEGLKVFGLFSDVAMVAREAIVWVHRQKMVPPTGFEPVLLP